MRLCGLFSRVRAGHSHGCCFNPSAPALVRQWGSRLWETGGVFHTNTQTAQQRNFLSLHVCLCVCKCVCVHAHVTTYTQTKDDFGTYIGMQKQV